MPISVIVANVVEICALKSMKTCPRRVAVRVILATVLALVTLPGIPGISRANEDFSNRDPITVDCPPVLVCPPGEGNPYPSLITVSGLTGKITDANVTLHDLTYALKPADVDMMLVSPSGKTLLLMSDACGDNAPANANPITSAITLTFDDQADASLPADSPCLSGTFKPIDDDDDAGESPGLAADTFPNDSVPPAANRPLGYAPPPATQPLSTLNTTDPNGTWRLYVFDDSANERGSHPRAGRIAGGWTISLTTTTTGQTTSTLPDEPEPDEPEDPPPPYPPHDPDPKPPPGFRPGDLDPTLNPCEGGSFPGFCDGRLSHPVPSATDLHFQAHDAVVQPDGKIVAAGSSRDFGAVFALARYNADGSLDRDFGDRGIVKTLVRSESLDPEFLVLGAERARAFSVALYPPEAGIHADKIVVAGCVSRGACGDSRSKSEFALARYNADGTLDETFGADGKVTTPFLPGAANPLGLIGSINSAAVANAVAVQPDGKVVAAGHAGNSVALVRYNTDGILDDGFGVRGQISNGRPGEARAVAVLADNKIVVAGSDAVGGGNFALNRYTAAGQFDAGGMPTDFGASDLATDLAIDSGAIVVTGHSRETVFNGSEFLTFSKIAVARYNLASLTHDSTFNPCAPGEDVCAGRVLTALDGYDVASSAGVAVYPAGAGENAGKIVVAGCAGPRSSRCGLRDVGGWADTRFALFRYNADGTPDDSFGGSGQVTTYLENPVSGAEAVVLQPRPVGAPNRIVAVGFVAGLGDNGTVDDERFALAGYLHDGSLDTGFGLEGSVITRITAPAASGANTVALQSDGKVVVGGYAGDADFTLARYLPDGSLDPEFNPCQPGEEPTVDGCGGIVVTRFPGECQIPGTCTPDLNGTNLLSVLIQPNGRIVAVGGHAYWEGDDLKKGIALARYRRDGTIDRTFGTDGFVYHTVRCTSYGYSGTLDSKGNIVVAGVSTRYDCDDDPGGTQTLHLYLARFDSSGNFDHSFGSGRIVEVAGGYRTWLLAVKVYPPDAGENAGKILASGTLDNQTVVVRYHDTGQLDETFGDGGIVVTPIPGGSLSYVADLAIQPDGRIVGAGGFGAGLGFVATFHFLALRYNPDGSLDQTFNPCPGSAPPPPGAVCGGMTVTEFESEGAPSSTATSIAIQPDGGLVAAGGRASRGDNLWRFALARYKEDGTLDSGCGGFGGDGRVTTEWGAGAGSISEMVMQPDGNLVAVGQYSDTANGPAGGYAVARYIGGRVRCGFSAEDTTVEEPATGTAPATFTVTLETDLPVPATVRYATRDGSAVAGRDYVAASGTLVFGAGQRQAQVPVEVMPNHTLFEDTSFHLDLTQPTSAALIRPTAMATIENSTARPPDAPPATVAVGDVTVAETFSATVPAIFTVTLDRPSIDAVTVSYSTTDIGEATAGADYQHTSGDLLIAPGDRSGTITVPVLGDSVEESSEAFEVRISSPSGATLGRSAGTATILDAVGGLSIGDSSVVEGDAGATQAVFALTLEGPVSEPVTVGYATDAATAAADEDYGATTGTLTFDPGQYSKSVMVEVLGDTLVEATERFSVVLAGAAGAPIARAVGTGTIVDDDDEDELIALPQLPAGTDAGGPPGEALVTPALLTTAQPPVAPSEAAPPLPPPVPQQPLPPLPPPQQTYPNALTQPLTQAQAQPQAQQQAQQLQQLAEQAQTQAQQQAQAQAAAVAERDRERQVARSHVAARDPNIQVHLASSRDRATGTSPALAWLSTLMAAGWAVIVRRNGACGARTRTVNALTSVAERGGSPLRRRWSASR